jgi:hypothetical protein
VSDSRAPGEQVFCYTIKVMIRKTTMYLEEDLLRAAKIAAARTGKRDYEVVEEALRAYLGSSC